MLSVKGRRLRDSIWDEIPDDVRSGDFWKIINEDGTPLKSNDLQNLTGTVWRVVVPMSYGFAISGLMVHHTVREHRDGSISVRPGDGSSNSIKVIGHHGEIWHGYIEHGKFNPIRE